MYAQLLVFGAIILGAPPTAPGPKWEKGLEIRWTGTFSEASFRPGVRAARTYDVETRLFVVAAGDHGADAILFTRVFQQPERKSNDPPTGVVRLDFVQIGPRGHVQLLPSPADPDNPDPKLRPYHLVQLQALPTHEAGMFFERPEAPLKPGLTWTQQEPARPDIAWKVVDVETYRGYPALRLTAEQKTTNYYSERIRQSEWRRQEKLTVPDGKGYAARLERIIEKREPDSDELSFRSTLKLELQGRMVYSGQLYQERRDETIQAAAFTAMLDRALAAGGRAGAKPFQALVRRTSNYIAEHSASDTLAYREAIVAVRKRAEAAARGELPPAAPAEEPFKAQDPIALGQVIPDISAVGITNKETTTLKAQRGKALLIAYFQPTASSAPAVLKLTDELHARGAAVVLPLAIGDISAAKALQIGEKTVVPIYNGAEVYKTHGLTATPVFIVVDADGVIRHVARGWGAETAAALTREFERWAR